MEEGEGGIEKKVSAITGFITERFMMSISIYHPSLHPALDRSHTLMTLALLHVLFYFFLSWIYSQKFKAKSQYSMYIHE